MGRDKLLLPVRGRPAVLTLLQTALSVCEGVVLVLGANHDVVAPVVAASPLSARVKIAVNPQPERGMFSSVQVGLSHVPQGAPVFVQPGDQPLSPAAVYGLLLDALTGDVNAVAPAYEGHGGHPVLLAADFVVSLLSARPDSNLKAEMLSAGRVLRLPVSYPQVLHNWNTVTDLPPNVLADKA